MMGAVAAVQVWMTMNHEDRLADAERRTRTIFSAIEGMAGLNAEMMDNVIGHQPYGLNIRVDSAVAGFDIYELRDRLKEGDPPIWTRVRDGEDCITIHMFGLNPGEDQIVGEPDREPCSASKRAARGPMPSYSVAVDVGGTFTDIVLCDTATNAQSVHKTPSTPSDPSLGFMTGLTEILAANGVDASDVGHIFHGTTIATNSVLENRGAPVGLLVTEGFRYVLEIARHGTPRLANPNSWVKPQRPVRPRDCLEVNRADCVTMARFSHRLDEAGVRARRAAFCVARAWLPSRLPSCIPMPTRPTSGGPVKSSGKRFRMWPFPFLPKCCPCTGSTSGPLPPC